MIRVTKQLYYHPTYTNYVHWSADHSDRSLIRSYLIGALLLSRVTHDAEIVFYSLELTLRGLLAAILSHGSLPNFPDSIRDILQTSLLVVLIHDFVSASPAPAHARLHLSMRFSPIALDSISRRVFDLGSRLTLSFDAFSSVAHE